MQHSEQLGKIAAAIVAAQQAIEPAPKNADNPYFKSKYTPLPVVWSTVKPALGTNKLAVLQTFERGEDGRLHIVTTLLHASGEWISGTLTMPVVKQDPQAMGSAITYGRRYALASMLGVVSEEDDDGEAAMQRKPPKAGDSVSDVEELFS